jgi:dihydrofolate synthase / folylpolyglutamate synthase
MVGFQPLPTTLASWLEYISAQHPQAIAMGLARARTVAERLGIRASGPVITVGGTNGKGSTCAYLERILATAGYRVAKYSSPHLQRFNERVRVNLAEVTDSELMEAFAAVEAARHAGETIALTYFEFATLAAFWLFQSAQLDVWVVEVGMGGRLDTVNILAADVAIVVSVDLDHMEFLGPDRESIGFEKAGIFRAGRPAIIGDPNPPVRLLEHARDIGALALTIGHEFGFERQEKQWSFHSPRGRRHSLPVPALRGPYQLANASCALAALDALADRLPVAQQEIKRGLLEVELPGRLQVLPGRPTLVLDVAHNPHAARVLADALGTMGFYEQTFAVFGMMADKDIASVIQTLSGRVDHWLTVDLPVARAANALALADAIVKAAQAAATPYASVAAALGAAEARAGPNDRILVFGSFHVVGAALDALGRR